jgi:hypothetical protein
MKLGRIAVNITRPFGLVAPTTPRVAGPAFTVRCPPGDNLMLNAGIHRADRGSVIVVEADDVDYAVASGNVCAVAQRRGIAGFVIDGVIRDLAEVTKEAGETLDAWENAQARGSPRSSTRRASADSRTGRVRAPRLSRSTCDGAQGSTDANYASRILASESPNASGR